MQYFSNGQFIVNNESVAFVKDMLFEIEQFFVAQPFSWKISHNQQEIVQDVSKLEKIGKVSKVKIDNTKNYFLLAAVFRILSL